MKTKVKQSILAGLGGVAAATVAALLLPDQTREMGVFYLIFAAVFLLLNFVLFLPVSKMKAGAAKILTIALICIVNIALATGASVYYLQEKLLFYPNNSVTCFEQIKADRSFQTVTLTARDGTKLSGWLRLNAGKAKAPLILYFGGKGENSSKAFSKFLKQGTFSKFAGYNVMMVDYRGYGYSAGKPDDKAMFSDALDTYDYAVKQSYTDPSRVVAVGYSIGTGGAVYLASQRPAKGLILVAPYYSGVQLYNGMLDIFHGPLTYLVRYQFDTEKYAPKVKCRSLIFTSKKDKTINWRQSEALSKRFPSIAELEFIDSASHETYFQQAKATDEMQNYLAKLQEASK